MIDVLSYGLGVVSGVVLYMYKWKLGFLALKGLVTIKTMVTHYFRQTQDIIIPTAVENVEEHIFNNASLADSHVNEPDYRKIYLISSDINIFKQNKDTYLEYTDDFLCCFLKSRVMDNVSNEELLDVSSQLKKAIFYIKTDPTQRCAFSVQTFLDVCHFSCCISCEDSSEPMCEKIVEILWVTKDLEEYTKRITQETRNMDLYDLFNAVE